MKIEHLIKNIKKGHINIISYEGYILSKFEMIFLPDISYSNRFIDTISKNIKVFKKTLDYKLEVKIICVLREQAFYIESFYLQQVKTRRIRESFETFKTKII